jgi:N-acetylglucosaminyldiphosphoundecaprenol N-acetyl-beta-D-mannosaminyltransferase
MSAMRVNILGVGISAINITQAVGTIDEWIQRREQHYVTVTPVHGIMDCWNDPELRQIFNSSGMTTPDGMPLVWLARLAGHRHVRRVYGPDLMLAVCEHGLPIGYRHFLYGGEVGVAELLANRLLSRLPGLHVVGTYTPPYRALMPEEDCAIVECINASEADIVWVGLSTPRQERWMAAHLGHISSPVMIGVGAAFDFLSGRKPQAPRWMQRSGLEWLFRLASEPRRLWPRYRRYPRFVLLLAAQASGIINVPLETEASSASCTSE